jgi:fatty acid desaturase
MARGALIHLNLKHFAYNLRHQTPPNTLKYFTSGRVIGFRLNAKRYNDGTAVPIRKAVCRLLARDQQGLNWHGRKRMIAVMRDHKDFISALPTARKTALAETSDLAGLRHLALHVGIIGLGAALIGFGVPGWPLWLPIHGVAVIFLFTLEHECTHRTPFGTVRLNDWIGRCCGLLILLPFEWFRYFHLAHHRFTNIPGKDPELDSAKPQTPAAFLRHVSGVPIWWGNARLLIRLARGREAADYLPQGALARMEREARVMLTIYALVSLSLLWSPILFWIWLLPVLIGQPVLRIYLLAEHGDCPFVTNMFENTRTTLTNRIVRFFAWNMPYHVEHHVLPAVPFHRLPELHRLIRGELRETANGYAQFARDYLARRR